jgi:hypothetical protein
MPRKVTLAGIVAVHNFPLSAHCIKSLAQLVHHLHIWFDMVPPDGAGNENVLDKVVETCKPLVENIHVIRSDEPWSIFNFRESLIRSLDDIKPSYVLCPDSDEEFQPGFREDMKRLMDQRKRHILTLDFNMITDDGRKVEKSPNHPHCKMFRWFPNISYAKIPLTGDRIYQGRAFPNLPLDPLPRFKHAMLGKSLLNHYCYYTREIERQHKENRKWRGC